MVTFLYTAVEDVTTLWEQHPDAVDTVLARHEEIQREVFNRMGGRVFATRDGSVAVAFDDLHDAVEAAVDAQRGLADEVWPAALRLQTRMGLETGATQERDGQYQGAAPIRAARIMAAAHGGQVLVGAHAASLIDGPVLVDLGVHRLPDLPRAERLFQVLVDDAPSQFPALRTSEAHRGNLPRPTAGLLGRERLLADVVELLQAHRLVTLTGVGGVGKTRAALEIGSTLAAEFPDGVWMVELAPLTDPAAVAAAVASTLGINPQAGTPISHTMAEALSGRRILLVLDNCEHVLAAAAETVRELLEQSTTVTVLATSRAALDVAGEQRRLVLPLALDGGASSPAVTLFVERARALQSRIDFGESATAAAVVEICRSLDGLPLAIELAAARTISMSPIDIRDRLGDRFRILTSSQQTPRRHQTLRDVVAWSYEMLDDEERSVLGHAAVFQGGFDLAAITGALDATDELVVLDRLDSLVRRSLIVIDDSPGTTRYALLETIRQFAEGELEASQSLAPLRNRHAEYFALQAMDHWARWNGPAWRDSVDWLERELANLRAAFRWSWSRGRVETAADIAAHTAFMGASIQLFEPVGWAFEILEDAARAGVPHLPRVYAGAAWTCFIGRADEAVAAAEIAVRLDADSHYEPYEPGLSGLVEALSNVYAGHLDRYIDAAERVVALGGNARGWGLSLLLDGLQASGRVDEAIALTGPAMAAARELGNPFFIAYAYWTTGAAYSTIDPAAALSVWREGLAYVRQHRVDFFVGFITRDAARLRLVDADPEDALAMFDAAIEAFQEAGNVAQLTITLASATALFEQINRLDSAATLYAAISRQPGSESHVPDLPDLADRLKTKLGGTQFGEDAGRGVSMDLNDTAHYARQEIQRARVELRERAATAGTRPGGLSVREVEVVRLLAEGLTTRQIAEQLFISARTADRHIQNIYTKIGTSNRAATTRWAVDQGLTT